MRAAERGRLRLPTPTAPSVVDARSVVSAFVERLAEAIDALEQARERSPRDFWRAALAVEHVVLSDAVTDAEAVEILRRLEEAGKVAACQGAFAQLEPMIERGIAARVVADDAGLLQDSDTLTANYLARYQELARREAALSAMTAEDGVLFLGSGPLPISAIEYCKQTGCRADCVDLVEDAIHVSRRVIRALGMQDRIRCHLARAEELPADGWSVVLIGVLARPKDAIFRNVAATRSAGSRVLARTSFGLRTLIYAPLEPEFTTPERLRNATASVARGDQVLSAIRGLKL